jgi:ribonuclease PH
MEAQGRMDGRHPGELRPLKVEMGYSQWAEGSVLLDMGNTRVLATATFEERVPRFLVGSGSGWVTAEYSMLPRSTSTRTPREVQSGRPSGRTQEIQRLIGRSLRAATNLERMGECAITIDCDVLQADGGTRAASITAGYLALAQAVRRLSKEGSMSGDVLGESIAAVSAGILGDELLLDLSYEEDSRVEVDLNVVMTASGRLVELQGTAEGTPFSREDLDRLLDFARQGIEQLTRFQRQALEG